MITEDRTNSVERAIREASRLGRVLTPALVADLDVRVEAVFRETQERVGVESGALKATGRSGSDLRDGGDTYVGYVSYGNDTPPVDYALYHLAANEPWFAGIPAHEEEMGRVIDHHLRAHVQVSR